MEHHQRSPIGNDAIIQYMLEWFRLPSRPDMVLWVSQILQGLAVTYGVEHWRRNAPRTMGTLYWQLNDCWPVASWSSIDWEGRWKALHYMMARAYAPLLLSAVENREAGTIRLYVTSDEHEPCETLLSWRMWTVDGEVIALGEEDVDVPASGTVEAVTLEFDEQIEQLGEHTLIFFGELYRGDTRESDVVVTFVRPKHLDLKDPRLSVDRHPGEGGREQWVIGAEKPALWVWPDLPGVDMRYSERFFHLEPDHPRTVTVAPGAAFGGTLEAVPRSTLEAVPGVTSEANDAQWHSVPGRVYSLFDTFGGS